MYVVPGVSPLTVTDCDVPYAVDPWDESYAVSVEYKTVAFADSSVVQVMVMADEVGVPSTMEEIVGAMVSEGFPPATKDWVDDHEDAFDISSIARTR